MLPDIVTTLVSSAPAVGLSGSRSVVPVPLSVVETLAFLCPPAVAIGCARGVDAAFRRAAPWSTVFRARGRERYQFVLRSVECVEWVEERGGLWVSFPSSPCPVGVLPSPCSRACFSGGGSGSWASLALALGRGVPCAVFLGSLPCPAGFGLSSVGDGWFVAGLRP